MYIATMPSTTPTDQVRELRHASRMLVRVLGILRHRLGEHGCTPAQCHALIELAERGPRTAAQLAEVLEVDKSTAGRTVAPLVRAGLLEHLVDPNDRRAKPVQLTEAGRERVRAIHAASDRQVEGALALLGDEEREVVLRGVSLYERALHRARAQEGTVLRPIEPRDDPAMAAIIRQVMTEHGAVGAGYSIEDAEVDAMAEHYAGERCAFFVVERGGEVVAGAGIAPLAGAEDESVCELRKMYALPSVRGIGIGRRLLERCLEAARAEGFRLCYLETLQHMHLARALYEKVGFRPLDAPMGNTGHHSCNGWYAMEL